MARYEFNHRKPRRRKPRFSQLLLVITLLVTLVYPFYEAYHLNVETTVLQIADLPSNLKNLKIAYVTDILRGPRFSQSRVNKLVNTLNGLSADLVLFGGNYAQNSDEAIDFFASLPNIQSRLGVFAVLGENDRTEPESNLTPLVKAMKARNITPLVNSVEKVKVGKTALYLAGADDCYNGTPDVQAIASQVSADEFVIFLANSPDLITDALKAVGSDGDNHWFDMALFGHTLGGQVTLFGYPLIAKLSPAVGTRYLSGWREENRAKILVSNGVGTVGFPVRLFAPAQIHLITLKKQ